MTFLGRRMYMGSARIGWAAIHRRTGAKGTSDHRHATCTRAGFQALRGLAHSVVDGSKVDDLLHGTAEAEDRNFIELAEGARQRRKRLLDLAQGDLRQSRVHHYGGGEGKGIAGEIRYWLLDSLFINREVVPHQAVYEMAGGILHRHWHQHKINITSEGEHFIP